MPLLFNYLKMPDCFIGWNASFAENLITNTEHFTNHCDGNQLNYNNDLPAVGNNNNCALQKPFETDFFTCTWSSERSYERNLQKN